jgi:hypothetical protein
VKCVYFSLIRFFPRVYISNKARMGVMRISGYYLQFK